MGKSLPIQKQSITNHRKTTTVFLFLFLSLFIIFVTCFNSETDKRRYEKLSQSNHIEVIKRSISMFVNRTLMVSVVVREPFVIYNEPEELVNVSQRQRMAARGDINNYSGIAIEVIKRLRYIFKFKIAIKRPRDNQFGVFSKEQNAWTGLMGDLVRKEADVGVTALSITMSRSQAIDFTRAYHVETSAILMRIPEEVENYFAIFQPFTTEAWFLLLATILLLIFLVTIMMRLEEKQLEQEEKVHELQFELEGRDEERFESMKQNDHIQSSDKLNKQTLRTSWLERFYYAVTCVINILLIRDIKHPPEQTPIRILVCSWWLSTIIIVNIYLGILFGQLVVPHRPKSIETLEELLSQNKMPWCVTQGSSIYDLFKKAEATSVYGQLGMRMRTVSSADDGVRKVIDSGWAFIREKSILIFKAAREHNRLKSCKMQLAKEQFYSVGFGLGLVKNSTYLEAFNSALTLMIENGFVSHWESMYWPRKNQYTECSGQATEGEPLTMKHFISIYLVCSILIGCAAVTLINQQVFQSFRYKIRNNNDKCVF